MVSISSVSSVNFGKNPFSLLLGKEQQTPPAKPSSECITNLNLQPNSYPISGVSFRPQSKSVPQIVSAGSKAFLCDYKSHKESDIIAGEIENKYVQGKHHPKYCDNIPATPLPIDKEIHYGTLNIENLVSPNGTIAIPATFDEHITTGGLWQCVGISIVDKTQNLQTLVHYCPSVNGESNKKLLDYILSASNPKNVEISLVPGCYEATDKTLADIMKNLEDFQKEKESKFKSIEFKYFPSDEYSNLILHNGVLRCSSYGNIKHCDTNPKERIVYASIDRSKKPRLKSEF